MSTTVVKPITLRRWQGSLDPALPIGAWMIAINGTGDASGGDQSIEIAFATSAVTTLNSNIYSLEQISIDQSQAGDDIALLNASNLDREIGLAMDHRWAVELLGTQGGLGAVRPRDLRAMIGIFLGAQRVIGINASLSIIIDNVLGNVLRAHAQGYYWSPRSILVDGGPQRPPRAMYGT